MPMEDRNEDGQLIGFSAEEGQYAAMGSVLCIEGVSYGDGQTEHDYSESDFFLNSFCYHN
jgi:hypothetical protein